MQFLNFYRYFPLVKDIFRGKDSSSDTVAPVLLALLKKCYFVKDIFFVDIIRKECETPHDVTALC